MKIQCGKYKLLDSMTIIQVEGENISFEVVDVIEGNMCFEVSFINDNKNKDGYTQVVAIDNLNAKIIIANTTYGGNSSTMHIGTYQHKYKLFLNFRIINIIDNSRTIILNLYIKEKEE